MRTGVFGGTFNPVHYGHLRAAEEAVEALALDKVLFVPAGSPPLKQEGLASIEDRLRMVELAISGNPAMELSRVESGTDSTSYTVDTLRTLSGLHPGDSLVFILGVALRGYFPRCPGGPGLGAGDEGPGNAKGGRPQAGASEDNPAGGLGHNVEGASPEG